MKTRVELNEKITKEIEDEEKKEKNKKILKILSFIFIPIFIIFSISYISLRFIGNIGIVVREYPIYNAPKDFNGIKIMHFSDIHYSSYSSYTKIEKLVEIINHTNPDIIFFTGDLIDSSYTPSLQDKEFFIESLSNLKTSIGKYYVLGEDDNNTVEEILKNCGFIEIPKEGINIYKDKSFIRLFSVENSKEELSNKIADDYTIVLTHYPDLSDYIVNNLSPNLILAGHSHNGQVRIPFIGPLMKREKSKKYIDSYYKINNTELYISGGIGNVKYNFRLFNHPSINFYRLKSKTS